MEELVTNNILGELAVFKRIGRDGSLGGIGRIRSVGNIRELVKMGELGD